MKALRKCSKLFLPLTIGLGMVQIAGRAQVTSPGGLVLTAADNGTTAEVVVGEAVDVQLHGNPSTGYSWSVSELAGGAVLTNGPAVYTPDLGGGVGGGGTFEFPFLAVAVGETTVALGYRPPGGGPPVQTFSLTIQVSPPPISIALMQTNVVLSWPVAGSTNYFLEGTTSLQAPQWAALNALPLQSGTNYTVSLGAEGTGLYFRLRHE